MKNAIAALSIPFLFFIVLKVINFLVSWVFNITVQNILDNASIIFTCFVSGVFTLAFYICVLGWLNEKK